MEKHLIEGVVVKGYINNIIKSSIVDGPNNRIAIFMQGCNYNCKYCHNPETISFGGTKYSPDQLYFELEKYFPFVQGITFSGGEALLQQEFITKFFTLIKNSTNLTCFIDTNGSVIINKELLEVCDYFMLDVKVVDNNEHLNLTSHSNDLVLKNLKLLNHLGKLYEVRTVIYPGYDHTSTIEYVKNHISEEVIYKEIQYKEFGVREEFKKYFAKF